MKWNMFSSEDKILIKTCGNFKRLVLEDTSKNLVAKNEKANIGRLCAKVMHNQCAQQTLL